MDPARRVSSPGGRIQRANGRLAFEPRERSPPAGRARGKRGFPTSLCGSRDCSQIARNIDLMSPGAILLLNFLNKNRGLLT